MTAALLVGRDAELATLRRVLDADGPRVSFVYGMAGIGKSTLLGCFGALCKAKGVHVATIDCRSIEPTPDGCIAALDATGVTLVQPGSGDPVGPPACSTVVLIDTYEVFRIADPWLRHELLPALGPAVRVVVAGREPPMLEWAIERGQIGGLEVLPLGPLDDPSVDALVAAAGIADSGAAAIVKLCNGHPLALRLAIEAYLAGGSLPPAESMQRVVHALAGSFRAGLDEPVRRALDAASVPRRITRDVLSAMLGDDAEDGGDAALERLSTLALVEATADGLRLHDAVHLAIVERSAPSTHNASVPTAPRPGVTCRASRVRWPAATSPVPPPTCCSSSTTPSCVRRCSRRLRTLTVWSDPDSTTARPCAACGTISKRPRRRRCSTDGWNARRARSG